jgi:heme exporter protein CcmD
MDLNASHIGFVIGAYALSALLLAGLVILTIARDRKLRHEAARLDEQRRKVAE